MTEAAFAAMDAAVVGDPDPEIVALEARLRTAQLTADILFTRPDGRLATREEDLAAHATGALRFQKHEPEELRVRRVSQEIAVTALQARLSVEVAGQLRIGSARYTRVWARPSDGDWRVVAGHVSMVPVASVE